MKILLIDDDEVGIKSLASFLEKDNHCCHAFTAPEQAIEAYRRNRYDFVIADMNMPGMNGLEVLQRVRSINTDAKVVIVTGHMDCGDHHRCPEQPGLCLLKQAAEDRRADGRHRQDRTGEPGHGKGKMGARLPGDGERPAEEGF